VNFTGYDWAIVVAVYVILIAGVLYSKRYMRSVADFLAAGRTAGRYLISVSAGIAGIGAITIVGNLEMNFEAGFAMSWWGLSMGLVLLVLAVSGWVIYRFRSTRSLTLPEFFERRYSRNFRIASGAVCFVSGLINFAIFPSVGARFFIYFVGLPEEFTVFGTTFETFPVTMFVLLATSLWFVFAGGQVTVIFTDFLQGLFANVVFIVIPVYLLLVVGWDRLASVLVDQPPGKSLVNPFDTAYIPDFNFGYFLIGVFGILLRGLGWQGEQAYNVSATSAHEAKMGGVLAMWRGMPMGLMMLLVPILAAVVMQHPDFTSTANAVTEQLGGIEHVAVQKQLQTPLVLTRLLPAGLMGMLAAMMLAAFISTHDTYLHSWGSIFIQDVVMPFRAEPLDPRTHLMVLRFSYFGVALFAFYFSWHYVPAEAILLFFAITGAIFAGWAGIVTIGGLYWRWGNTWGAWAALSVGVGTSAEVQPRQTAPPRRVRDRGREEDRHEERRHRLEDLRDGAGVHARGPGALHRDLRVDPPADRGVRRRHDDQSDLRRVERDLARLLGDLHLGERLPRLRRDRLVQHRGHRRHPEDAPTARHARSRRGRRRLCQEGRMTFARHAANPILTRDDIPDIPPLIRDPSSVFNPGAVWFEDEVRLLLRVQTRGRRTYLVPARSADGVNFDVADRVAVIDGLDAIGGTIHHVYDPRLTIVEGKGYGVFAVDTDDGCRLVTAKTADFERFTVIGVDADEDLRNGVLFPERVGGRYLRLDRPNRPDVPDQPGSGDEIRLSESDDLATWRPVGPVMRGRPHYFDELIGAGPPPVKTRDGWLLVYHGIATHFAAANVYQAGVALLDLADPTRVIARGTDNVLEPRETWELTGQVPNVVFPTGLIVADTDRSGFAVPDARVLLYYGAADTSVGLAVSNVEDLLRSAHE